MEKEQVEKLRAELLPALRCKYDEFRLLGYERVTLEQIWECLWQKKWKTKEKKLYELVSDILSLSIGEYMAFVTMSSYREQHMKADDLQSLVDELS